MSINGSLTASCINTSANEDVVSRRTQLVRTWDIDALEDLVIHLVDKSSAPHCKPPMAVHVLLILDMAELRFCKKDFSSCLELCGRALRIADDRNMLYLLGSLYKPLCMLTPAEREDRARLAKERRVHRSHFVRVALILFEMGVTHERNESYEHAFHMYLQSVTSLELIDKMNHPIAVEALNGAARVQIHLGDLGGAQLYLDWGQEVIKQFHEKYGAYQTDEDIVMLITNLRKTVTTLDIIMRSRQYLLLGYDSHVPQLAGFPLYL